MNQLIKSDSILPKEEEKSATSSLEELRELKKNKGPTFKDYFRQKNHELKKEQTNIRIESCYSNAVNSIKKWNNEDLIV